MTWRDLSDDELRARIAQRAGSDMKMPVMQAMVDMAVEQRDDEEVAQALDELFDEVDGVGMGVGDD